MTAVQFQAKAIRSIGHCHLSPALRGSHQKRRPLQLGLQMKLQSRPEPNPQPEAGGPSRTRLDHRTSVTLQTWESKYKCSFSSATELWGLFFSIVLQELTDYNMHCLIQFLQQL